MWRERTSGGLTRQQIDAGLRGARTLDDLTSADVVEAHYAGLPNRAENAMPLTQDSKHFRPARDQSNWRQFRFYTGKWRDNRDDHFDPVEWYSLEEKLNRQRLKARFIEEDMWRIHNNRKVDPKLFRETVKMEFRLYRKAMETFHNHNEPPQKRLKAGKQLKVMDDEFEKMSLKQMLLALRKSKSQDYYPYVAEEMVEFPDAVDRYGNVIFRMGEPDYGYREAQNAAARLLQTKIAKPYVERLRADVQNRKEIMKAILEPTASVNYKRVAGKRIPVESFDMPTTGSKLPKDVRKNILSYLGAQFDLPPGF
jgi:hypothetical protein